MRPRIPDMALIFKMRPTQRGDNITVYRGYLNIVAIFLVQLSPTYLYMYMVNNLRTADSWQRAIYSQSQENQLG